MTITVIPRLPTHRWEWHPEAVAGCVIGHDRLLLVETIAARAAALRARLSEEMGLITGTRRLSTGSAEAAAFGSCDDQARVSAVQFCGDVVQRYRAQPPLRDRQRVADGDLAYRAVDPSGPTLFGDLRAGLDQFDGQIPPAMGGDQMDTRYRSPRDSAEGAERHPPIVDCHLE
jgi:hypothetical protein